MRVDAVTSPGVVNRQPGGRFLDRVMQDTYAAFLGITFDSVAVGTPIHTVMTGGTTAAMVEPGAQHDAAAATFAIATLTPKRMSARYVWRVEDVAKLEGLEAALQRDLSRVMAINMDNALISGQDSAGGAEADIGGIVGEANAQTVDIDLYGANAAAGVEVAKILAGFAGLVDGTYAKELTELRTLMTVDVNQLAISTFMAGNQNNMTQRAVLRQAGLDWVVHETLGGGGVAVPDNGVAAVGSRPRHREGVAVQAVWPTVSLIRDPYTGAGKGEIALTALALWDFKILRSESFYKVTNDES